jgi:hypothetical protein
MSYDEILKHQEEIRKEILDDNGTEEWPLHQR